MSNQPRWGVGSNQHKKRPRITLPPGVGAETSVQLPSHAMQSQIRSTGVSWQSEAIDWSLMGKGPVDRSVARFRSQLSSHVWDAAKLEGNTFTLPEVQTLLEGTTIGGHRQDEADQVLALAESSKRVADMVQDGTFANDRAAINEVHHLVARFEALDAGKFRGEGPTRGGGLVNLGGQGTYQATGSEDGGAALRDEFERAVDYLQNEPSLHPAERAIAYFGVGTLHQFFFDGNKRTSRLMMNGWLMTQGYDAISIPAARRLEFNQHLIKLYSEKDATDLMDFIVDCRPRS